MGIVVLGLDLSVTATGIVAMEEGGRVIFNGVVGRKLKKTASETERVERMVDIANAVVAAVQQALAYGQVHVVAEGYAFGATHGHADLGELRGMVKQRLWEMDGRTIVAIPPSRARKVCFGRGGIAKTLVAIELEEQYGFCTEDDNIADAFVVAEAHRRELLSAKGEDNGI